jgi:hypothetical protein
MAGAGADVLVGDVLLSMSKDHPVVADADSVETTLEVANLNGDNNIFNAFNDTLMGDAGEDILVGDVYSAGGLKGGLLPADPEQVFLTVTNGGGGDNVFDAFNDNLDGGDGAGTLVGDVFFDVNVDNSADDPLVLTVSNEGNSDNNTFNAFNDIMDGGADADTIVGDVFYDAKQGALAHIDIAVGNADGGEGNTFNAFNDTLNGGGGDDLLVGDILLDSENVDVSIDVVEAFQSGGGTFVPNTFDVFNDTINGGDGDDTIYGDFFNLFNGMFFSPDGELPSPIPRPAAPSPPSRTPSTAVPATTRSGANWATTCSPATSAPTPSSTAIPKAASSKARGWIPSPTSTLP